MAVGVFFVMSGYVCSIKPLKLARQGKADEVRKVIGSSIFRRQLRLGLPATIATTISWTVDRLGGFALARSLPGNIWLCFHTPVWMDFSTSVRALFSCYVCLLFRLSRFARGLLMVPLGRLFEINSKRFNGQWHMKSADPLLCT
jgi:hypothetical protein